MQRPDEAKRQAIIDTAAALFARHAYHEVKLDDVASAARIGKGTVYVYFDSKEQLYDSLVLDRFSEIVCRLRRHADAAETRPAMDTLADMVGDLVQWTYKNPHFFELIRSNSSDRIRPKLRRRRKQLGDCFAKVIKQGVRRKELVDPLPDVTAQLIPAFVRSVVRWGPARLPAAELTRHILRIVHDGIGRRV